MLITFVLLERLQNHRWGAHPCKLGGERMGPSTLRTLPVQNPTPNTDDRLDTSQRRDTLLHHLQDLRNNHRVTTAVAV